MLQKNWKTLIQPNKQAQVSESNPNIATLTIEPLERGFGMTLGNALRRVLMSSLQGAAVTAIQAVYVPADDFTDPAVTAITVHMDSMITLSRELAADGQREGAQAPRREQDRAPDHRPLHGGVSFEVESHYLTRAHSITFRHTV